MLLAVSAAAVAPGPSFSCRQVESGSVEALVCEDVRLSGLDRKLAAVYSAASAKATNERRRTLRQEQRGWIKGRNECRKNDDQRACVESEYEHRIAELMVKYRLIQGTGPFTFACDGASDVVATFFQTDPPTVFAQRNGSGSLLYLQPSDSGAKYEGRNQMFWHHQDEALITWGTGAAATRCKAKNAGDLASDGSGL